MKPLIGFAAAGFVVLAGCASTPSQQSVPSSSSTPAPSNAVPKWMVLQRGTHVIIPEAPWPHASFSSGRPAVVTSKREWQRYYDNTSYLPASPPGAVPGSRAVVTSSIVEDQRYGGGGAFLDGWVTVSGRGWRGLTYVKQLVPVVPVGVEIISVPDGSSSNLYASASATSSVAAIGRYTHMRTLGVAISVRHPSDEKSARLHVRVTSGHLAGRTGWIDLDTAALPGIKPDKENDTSVNDACQCDFISMIPDFVAARYTRMGPPSAASGGGAQPITSKAVSGPRNWYLSKDADLYYKPLDFCRGVYAQAKAYTEGGAPPDLSQFRKEVSAGEEAGVLGHTSYQCPQTDTITNFTHVRVNGADGYIFEGMLRH